MLARFLLALSLPLVLTGCAYTAASKVQLIDRNGIDVSGMPEGHVTFILKDPKFPEKYCMAPAPDALVDRSTSLSVPKLGPMGGAASAAAGSGGDAPGKGALSIGSTANDMNLGGRSPTVLIVREVLYRFCEFSLNAELPKEDQIQLWRQLVPALISASLSGTAPATPPAQPGTSSLPPAPVPPLAGTAPRSSETAPAVEPFNPTGQNGRAVAMPSVSTAGWSASRMTGD